MSCRCHLNKYINALHTPSNMDEKHRDRTQRTNTREHKTIQINERKIRKAKADRRCKHEVREGRQPRITMRMASARVRPFHGSHHDCGILSTPPSCSVLMAGTAVAIFVCSTPVRVVPSLHEDLHVVLGLSNPLCVFCAASCHPTKLMPSSCGSHCMRSIHSPRLQCGPCR